MIIPKGKKSQVLLYGLMFAIVAAIIISFIDDVKTKKEFGMIGESSLALIDSSIEAERALLYIDQSAKYSVHQTIYDLAKNGGCDKGEKYLGYTLWDVNNKDTNGCYPDIESSKNSYLNIFSGNLNNYLSKYESVELMLDKYNLNFEDKQLVGIAIEPLKISIETGHYITLYSTEHTFKLNMDYDFSDYEKLRGSAEELVEKCKGKKKGYIESCINTNKINIFNKNNFELMEDCVAGEGTTDSTKHIFCVKSSNNAFYVYDEKDGTVELRNIVYRFALVI